MLQHPPPSRRPWLVFAVALVLCKATESSSTTSTGSAQQLWQVSITPIDKRVVGHDSFQ